MPEPSWNPTASCRSGSAIWILGNVGISAKTIFVPTRWKTSIAGGLPVVLEEAISHALADCDHLHVSFDIDVIDPRFAPGTGTALEGGFTYREAHGDGNDRRDWQGWVPELVEVNPVLDHGNKTAEVGVANPRQCAGRGNPRINSLWGSLRPLCSHCGIFANLYDVRRTEVPSDRGKDGVSSCRQ